MTQAEIKFARSLSIQKYRKEHNAYLIEGDKIVKEWIEGGATLLLLIATHNWLQLNQHIIPTSLHSSIREVPYAVIEKISNLNTAPEVIAVVQQKAEYHPSTSTAGWSLVLDRIQDPGNLGTIIRTADWFGINEILCTPGCVELYNPKVVQSTMGSLLRVNIGSINLDQLTQLAPKPIFVTAMSGTSVYDAELNQLNGGYLVMGNESKGVDPQFLHSDSVKRITIPRLGRAESLNVAMATGIICALIRQPMKK